jgi:triosephosphate isomerase|tara:strand:+ start:11097 stop:11753 length:657 start_codon:yes stop_codon:yes gene_type:complete
MGLVILNFKAYEEATGSKAEELSKICKETAEATGARIIVAPQTADILRTSPLIETIAQSASSIKPGSGTGSNLVESLKQAGAVGSILNHSEHRIPHMQISETVLRLKEAGMISVVCAQDDEEAKALAEFAPDYIAVEPPELIGSGVSVSQSKPEVVTKTVENIKQVNPDVKVLCGAGISNGSDVKKALELGVDGVLLASAFTKAADPRAVLLDICGGL